MMNRREPLMQSYWAVLTFFGLTVCSYGQSDNSTHSASTSALASAETIERLIEQLGSESFLQRELATERLLDIGLTAIPALKKAQHHADREIRYRGKRIHSELLVLDREKKIASFLSQESIDRPCPLPSWPRYEAVVGDTERSRALFARMLHKEWELLELLDQDAFDASAALAERCRFLQEHKNAWGNNVDPASIAVLLLAASADQTVVSEQLHTQLYLICRQVPSHFQTAVRGRPVSPLRGLLAQWILKGGVGFPSIQRLHLALHYDLREGLILAHRVLTATSTTSSQKQMPILVLTKLGDESHIPLLNAQLSDTRACGTFRDTKTKEAHVSQVRDIALAAVIHLRGMNPKAFGFSQIRSHPVYGFTKTSIGFSSDQTRQAAFKKWFATRKLAQSESQ